MIVNYFYFMPQGMSSAVVCAFITLYERGLIYRGVRSVNYCPSLQSVISDIEVSSGNCPSLHSVISDIEVSCGYCLSLQSIISDIELSSDYCPSLQSVTSYIEVSSGYCPSLQSVTSDIEVSSDFFSLYEYSECVEEIFGLSV